MKMESGKGNGDEADQVNIDELVTKEQSAPTDIVSDCGDMKGLDANRYATKKTVAQGMLDIALLTSNASQLKYVLQVGPKHEFYTLLVVLISISIVLQLLVGLLFVIIGGLDLNDHEDQPSAVILNDVIVILIFVISVINIVNSAFGIEYSNNPLASAGVLALIISFMDGEASRKHKKIADWLYHTSVGMMTGVMFCDVMKMTFGLDPALSLQDYLGHDNASLIDLYLKINKDKYVLSAIVAVVLSSIYNINHQPDHRKAEVLNNASLVFKVFSITVNIIISIFYSMQIDIDARLLST